MEALTPDLFHVDYGRLLETLITIIVLSFLIERIISFIFENRLFIDWVEERKAEPEEKDEDGNIIKEAVPAKPKKKGVRELIALIFSIGVCFYLNFDGFTIIFQSNDEMTTLGIILTGFIIAGGSKASLALFKDLMGVMSSAEKERLKIKELENEN